MNQFSSISPFYAELTLCDLRVMVAVVRLLHKISEPGYLSLQNAKNNPTMTNPWNPTDGDKREVGQLSGHFDVNLSDELFWSTKSYANIFNDERWVKFSEPLNVPQQELKTNEVQYGATTSLTYRPKVNWLDDFSLEGGFDIQEQDNKSQRYRTIDRVRQVTTRNQAFNFYVYGGFTSHVQAI